MRSSFKTWSFALFVALVFLPCIVPQSSVAQDAEPELFGQITHVVVRSADDIYVADRQTMSVRLVDGDGRLKQTYGSPGAGPGEFRRISAVTVDHDKRVIVFDNHAQKTVVFAPDGSLLSDESRSEIKNPQRLKQTDDGRFIALTGESLPETGSRFVFSELDSTFHVISEFGHTTELNQDSTGFFARFTGFNPGYFDVRGKMLVYAPPIYSGTVYLFEKQAGAWGLQRAVPGSSIETALETYDPKKRPRNALWIRSNTHGDSAGLILSRSIGIHILNDRQFVHFFLHDDGDQVVLKQEVFSFESGLEEIHVMDEAPPFGASRGRAYVEIPAYHDGQFYMIDSKSEPHIRVVNLK